MEAVAAMACPGIMLPVKAAYVAASAQEATTPSPQAAPFLFVFGAPLGAAVIQ